MRAPDRFEFHTERRHTREAMLSASKMLMRGTRKVPSMILTNILTLLTALGGAALLIFLGQYYGFNAQPYFVVGFLIGGGLYLLSFQMLYFEIARQVSQKPIHLGRQVVTLDETGMTYEGGTARWVTPWAMIDDVAKSRNTIALIVGGLAFPIPHAAIGDKAAVTQLVADIREQIANA